MADDRPLQGVVAQQAVRQFAAEHAVEEVLQQEADGQALVERLEPGGVLRVGEEREIDTSKSRNAIAIADGGRLIYAEFEKQNGTWTFTLNLAEEFSKTVKEPETQNKKWTRVEAAQEAEREARAERHERDEARAEPGDVVREGDPRGVLERGLGREDGNRGDEARDLGTDVVHEGPGTRSIDLMDRGELRRTLIG